MEHRHLDTKAWTAAAIDSALERGDLKDWKELFATVQVDRDVASLVLKVTSQRSPDGATLLAQALVRRAQPELSELKFPIAKDFLPPVE